MVPFLAAAAVIVAAAAVTVRAIRYQNETHRLVVKAEQLLERLREESSDAAK